MAKKRRHVQGPLRASAATVANDLEKSLYNLRTYYDQLSANVVEIPVILEHTLLLHSLVALVVQNGLLVVQGVSIAQVVWLIGTAFWMLRKKIVTMLLPHAVQVSRIALLVLMLAGLEAVCYCLELSLNSTQLVLFAIICLLDIASIYFDRSDNGRFPRKAIVLSAVENSLLVAGFSTFPTHTRAIVVDKTAFALTTMTAFVHGVVLLTTKYVVLHCFDSDINGTFVKTQQRGAKLMESLCQDTDSFEPEQLLASFAGASKKKKVKSKGRVSPPKTNSICNNASLDSTMDTQQSTFNEPRVQLAILTLVQMLLLLLQLLLSAFVLYSWEMTSALMLSSSRVLWTLGQVRRKVFSRHIVRPSDPKLKIA